MTVSWGGSPSLTSRSLTVAATRKKRPTIVGELHSDSPAPQPSHPRQLLTEVAREDRLERGLRRVVAKDGRAHRFHAGRQSRATRRQAIATPRKQRRAGPPPRQQHGQVETP